MFSKACEHGIKAIIYIATCSFEEKRVKIGEVAEHSGSPEAFTAKVLGTLTKFNIVNSYTGPSGGFYIDLQQMKTTNIGAIVAAIDGDSIYNGCGLGLHECDASRPCPMHKKFVKIRNELKEMLETTSIYDLAMDLKAGDALLVR